MKAQTYFLLVLLMLSFTFFSGIIYWSYTKNGPKVERRNVTREVTFKELNDLGLQYEVGKYNFVEYNTVVTTDLDGYFLKRTIDTISYQYKFRSN